MPASTTSSQPMPLAPINTTGLRTRSDSNGMGSPTSLMSNFSSGSPLTTVFTESSQISGEEPSSIAASIAPLLTSSEAPKTTRPHTLHHTQTTESRRSTESVDSQARSLRFNDFSRGRHSNLWLFRGLSVRGTLRKIVSKN
ncbi:uncharacterized protein LAJ45_02786 [Morchella importuna]|uniref:Uncharacterized protein n=1 Tax=Morchella conica CCBAS932 TaxID=1392247 RepID=A0A3N4KT78_9PEZI|nr:uncharacterized protein LAJ45_02786 [Morchella importuna]KAH8153199.1 hypothetical protein LAJ45_02786 [Morchella importuna]RPB12698.1 hypothetical protein P167DRAFT_535704 [Morchella conica CCBAS932]